jgi:3-methyladenine DNA glycosylase AlkD
MNIQKEAKHFRSQLKELADTKRAKGEKKYLKSPMQHYGVTVPALRKLAKSWIKMHPDINIEELITLTNTLWSSKWHEDRMLAVFLLEQKKEDLNLKHMPTIEKMINSATGWAQLDGISVWLVGGMIDNDNKTLKYLKRWIRSKNFWVRRTALLAQIMQFRRGGGDLKLFEQIAVPQFKEGKEWSKEERFFIRKAIGWALRELAPQKPNTVFLFIRKYRDQMSGLTFREAKRKLPSEFQGKLNN